MKVFDIKMKELGLTDTTLGAKIGKSAKTVYNYRSGDTLPDHITALKILEEIQVAKWSELMTEVEDAVTA